MEPIQKTTTKAEPTSEPSGFEQKYPEHIIARLMREHVISLASKWEFVAALRKAHEQFSGERQIAKLRSRRMAPREEVNALIKELRRLIKHLKDPEMQARLDMVTPLDPMYRSIRPDCEHIGMQFLDRLQSFADRTPSVTSDDSVSEFPAFNPEEHWTHFLHEAYGFLEILEAAAKLDGNSIGAQKKIKYDILSAALPLHLFWTNHLKRPASLVDRGGLRTPALEFLLDCLRNLDPKVKEAALRRLAKSLVQSRRRQVTQKTTS